MKAYQMMYTACGKAKNGAFSVWSKSNEITETECNEIMSLMAYRPNRFAPYDIEEETADQFFPKKYAYFALSSGRKCIAQTNYVGKVYSEMDSRVGNFFTHAYIFDNLEDCFPYAIFDTDAFKTHLTYKEWHDDPIVDDLPMVEVNFQAQIDEKKMGEFLSDKKRANVFSSILQATINSIEDGNAIAVNSTEEEQKLIYGMIGMLLPPSFYEKLTFCTQYLEQMEYALSPEMPRVKIKNFFEGFVEGVYNFEEKMNLQTYVFSFDWNIYSELTAGCYVREIIRILRQEGLAATREKIKKIESLIKMLSCDVDTAMQVDALERKDLTGFGCFEELKPIMELVINNGIMDAKEIAKLLHGQILKTKRWGIGNEARELIQFVYTHSDEETKRALVEEVFDDLEAFGVNRNVEPNAYVDSVKQAVPFAYTEFAKFFYQSDKLQGLLQKNADANQTYLVFDWLCLLTEGDEVVRATEEMLLIFARALNAKDELKIELYLKRVTALGETFERQFIQKAYAPLLGELLAERSDLQFAFKILLSLKNEQLKTELLQSLIKTNIRSVHLLSVYLYVANEEPLLFEKIENNFKDDEETTAFFVKKAAYVFKNLTAVTPQELNKYFKEYYLKGYDSGVFLIKLKEYVATVTKSSEKIKLLFAWYDLIAGLENDFCDVLQILEYIETELYALGLKELLKLSINQISRLTQINQRLFAANPNSASKLYDVLAAALLIKGVLGKKALPAAIEQNKVYEGMTSEQLNILAEEFLSEILTAYISMQNVDIVVDDTAMEVLIAPLFMQVADINVLIAEALREVKSSTYYEFLAEITAYAFMEKDELSEKFKAFITWYVKKLNRGSCKKLFKKMKELLSKEAYKAVEPFIEESLASHKGFFEKLFGKKKLNAKERRGSDEDR